MPIHTMNFTDRVFYAKPVGYWDNVDGRMWANAFKTHMKASTAPIVGMVDIEQVDRICSTIPKLLGELLLMNPDIIGLVFVTGQNISSQNSRALDKIYQLDRVKMVTTVSEAQAFAMRNLTPSFGAWTSQSVAYSTAMHYAAI